METPAAKAKVKVKRPTNPNKSKTSYIILKKTVDKKDFTVAGFKAIQTTDAKGNTVITMTEAQLFDLIFALQENILDENDD